MKLYLYWAASSEGVWKFKLLETVEVPAHPTSQGRIQLPSEHMCCHCLVLLQAAESAKQAAKKVKKGKKRHSSEL